LKDICRPAGFVKRFPAGLKKCMFALPGGSHGFPSPARRRN
jgi:hypothetical protein